MEKCFIRVHCSFTLPGWIPFNSGNNRPQSVLHYRLCPENNEVFGLPGHKTQVIHVIVPNRE